MTQHRDKKKEPIFISTNKLQPLATVDDHETTDSNSVINYTNVDIDADLEILENFTPIGNIHGLSINLSNFICSDNTNFRFSTVSKYKQHSLMHTEKLFTT